MAQVVRFSRAVSTTVVNDIKAALDAGAGAATIKLYTGTMPATPETGITSQVLLGTCTCTDPVGTESGGTLTFSAITQDSSADNSAKITMDFKHNFEELKIDAQKENTIYRVIQESLTNISKHSKASKSQIIILMNDNKINVTVSDNGIGFQVNELKKINSFGIIGIKERLSQIGSELKIDSNETGTILNFEIFI